MNFIHLLLALIMGSVGSVLLAASMLLLNNEKLERFSTYLTYFAGGILLAAALLGMIPKAISLSEPSIIFSSVLAGILFFFLLEKIILWRSCNNKKCERHVQAVAPIVLIGDGFHNAIDGIVIAAAFFTSIEFGIIVTFSVMLHEIPQELGDFGILIKSGLSKKKALLYNVLSGSTAIVAGVASYFFLDSLQSLIPHTLAFSAASFLYIALADLIPEMHRKTSIKESIIQLVLIIIGISMIMFLAHSH